MKTEFFVDYDLYDTTAIEDAQESTGSNMPFGNLELIKEDIPTPTYATLEHNFFVLDGSRQEMPENPIDVAYFSSALSDENGYFGSEQSIDIKFTAKHSSIGITLHFMEFYPLEVEITWYDLFGIFKNQKTFYPDSLDYFCHNRIEEYGQLKIIFKKVLPYHNAKLRYIEYGTTVTWNNDTIKSGKLINDTDPVSDKISTDKLTFEIVDSEDEFNLGNVSGLHKFFQRKQSMLPYEMVSGEKIVLGAFFLDDISTAKNVSKLSAIDYKGMLTNTDFKDGRIYNGENAGVIIAEIMAAAGIEDYTVDEETANTPLYGTLKIQTCQKALREVLFACGSIVNTAHRTDIEIRKQNRHIKGRITRNRKFETSIKLGDYISDVNVKYKTWTLEEKVSEITKGNYCVGVHTIQLSSPAVNMTTNIGTIIKQMPYYVVLKIDTEPGETVVISGQKYVGEELAAASSIEHIKAGEVRNTKTYTGTLLNFESAKKVADSILDYYQLQLILQTRHLAAHENAGDWTEVQNASVMHGDFLAAIESLSTDLTGGFISTAKCRGYYKLVTDYYYAGGELVAGNDAII